MLYAMDLCHFALLLAFMHLQVQAQEGPYYTALLKVPPGIASACSKSTPIIGSQMVHVPVPWNHRLRAASLTEILLREGVQSTRSSL